MVFGVREAAWPLIRLDLGLDYLSIGLLLAVPGMVGSAVEPLLGLLADTGHRRRILVSGGACFVASLIWSASAGGFAGLFLASTVLSLASGAYVNPVQATLMDGSHERRDHAMARWVAVGSVGVVAGPLLLAAAVRTGIGWRGALIAAAGVSVPVVVAVTRVSIPDATHEDLGSSARRAWAGLRSFAVVRWLVLLELTDLLGDVFLGFAALYFVDVAGASPLSAGLAIAVLSAAGLAGDLLLVRVLRRVDGLAWLRGSAAAMLVIYPAFLLLPDTGPKLIAIAAIGVAHAGWYAIPKARLFDEMHGSSGVATSLASATGLVGRLLPLGLGAAAQRFGLAEAMWALLAAPVAILVLLPPKAVSR